MKEVQVRLWDDVIFARTGEKVEAEYGSLAIEWAGTRRVLDLSDKTWHEIEDFIGPLLKIGRKPEPDDKPARPRGRKPAAYYDRMKTFAAEHGMAVATGADGKTRYPTQLRREFEAWLATTAAGGDD